MSDLIEFAKLAALVAFLLWFLSVFVDLWRAIDAVQPTRDDEAKK